MILLVVASQPVLAEVISGNTQHGVNMVGPRTGGRVEGAAEVGKPVYYRVHGPALLIEYENRGALNPASGAGANHIHSVLRIPGNDFGQDWLRRHHQQDHHG